MTSKTASGKSTTAKTTTKRAAKASAKATTKTTRKKNSSVPAAKSASRKSQSSTTKTTKRKSTKGNRKTAKAPAQPIGVPVYASDLTAVQASSQKQSSPVLPETLVVPFEELDLSPIPDDLPMEHWPAQILRLAEEAFAMTGSWVVFYRTMLGKGGVVDQFYQTADARRYFETTPEFAELLEMVTAIRSQDESSTNAYEPTRVITIRLPRSMHEATVREAKELELSINAYCVTKLLQPANPRFTPLETGKRRGRRPGPQITMETVKVKKS